MSQAMSQVLGQHMRLEQRLTPQLIQSMAILQKPVADLEAYINEALESNPALERADSMTEAPTSSTGSATDRNGKTAEGENADSFARLDRLSRSYDLDQDSGPFRARSSGGERDAKIDAMANTADRGKGLHEHLLEQWALTEVPNDIRRAGELIIQQLDPDGYLRTRLEEIASKAKPPVAVDVLEEALTEVRWLEPAGVGAYDLIECLLLQIDSLPGDNRIERKLVEHHLDDIVHNRLPAVARATGYAVGEIAEAIKAMRSTLTIHPGYLVEERNEPPIRPDVIVEYAETGGGLTVALSRGNAPKLTISADIADLAKTKAKRNGKAARDFARQHLEEANALIDAVRFRQHRLLEVARRIVERQSEFFQIGPQGLRVLRMSDLAEELSCDPSTISRTVADKYLQTPRGIFPLRYFFTGGTDTTDGDTTSWDSVKERVRMIIDEEDKKKPHSDDQVASLLQEEGIEISRRTVAKYRQQMSIPSARQRRQY